MEALIERIKEQVRRINACEEDDEFKSYKASPLLKELSELVEELLQHEETDALKAAYRVYGYMGRTYQKMGRMSVAAEYFGKQIKVAVELYDQTNERFDDIEETFYNAMKMRNYYVDDGVHDLMFTIGQSRFIDRKAMADTYKNVMEHPRTLKHDPVEMSEEYLAVIDEVEEKIDQNRTYRGMGSCHEIWALKEQYLLEKGIVWKSPALLNPNVRFD